MPDLVRHEVASSPIWVVKVGTRVLTDANGLLDEYRVQHLAEQLHQIAAAGRQVALVSSGAVGAGMGQLGIGKRPTDLAQLQAIAAIGQSYLVWAYDRALQSHGRHAAQVLLTAEDMKHRPRYLNVRNTLLKLFELSAIPIINENDTVAVAELQTTFGDNDRLAGLVANCLNASLLVILSDVAGLFDQPPEHPDAQVIPTVPRLTPEVMSLAVDKKTRLSKGGMASKLNAAKMVTTAGGNVVIASGREEGILTRILHAERIGTLFLPQGGTLTARKRWIGYAVEPSGKLSVDAGARRAVEQGGKSLLAIGITQVQGTFKKGDVLSLCDPSGTEFARGLTNYSSSQVEKIRGLRSEQIASVLGRYPYDEVIHRDNLIVLG